MPIRLTPKTQIRGRGDAGRDRKPAGARAHLTHAGATTGPTRASWIGLAVLAVRLDLGYQPDRHGSFGPLLHNQSDEVLAPASSLRRADRNSCNHVRPTVSLGATQGLGCGDIRGRALVNNLDAMRPSIQTAIQEALSKLKSDPSANDVQTPGTERLSRLLGDPTKGIGLRGEPTAGSLNSGSLKISG